MPAGIHKCHVGGIWIHDRVWFKRWLNRDIYFDYYYITCHIYLPSLPAYTDISLLCCTADSYFRSCRNRNVYNTHLLAGSSSHGTSRNLDRPCWPNSPGSARRDQSCCTVPCRRSIGWNNRCNYTLQQWKITIRDWRRTHTRKWHEIEIEVWLLLEGRWFKIIKSCLDQYYSKS